MLDLSAPSPRPLPIDFTKALASLRDVEFATPGGSLALRSMIAARYTTLTAEDILVTTGASEALAVLAAALGGASRTIALVPGVYPSFTEVARLAGATLVPWTGSEHVDAIVAANPSVPDGQPVDVPALIEAARAIHAIPVVDEVYRSIAVVGDVPTAAADLDPSAVSVADLSKPLGLGGLRIGWIATRNVQVHHAAARWLRLLTGGPSVLSEAAALAVLVTFDAHVTAHTTAVRANAPRVYEALEAHGWTVQRAVLGLTVFAVPPHRLTGAAVRAIEASGAFLVRGESFGRAEGVRVGLLTSPDRLRDALGVFASHAQQNALVVLMRAPERGVGKSRLATTIGAEATYRLADAFVRDTLEVATNQEWRTFAAVTPAAAVEGFAIAHPSIEVSAQVEGDLGVRIEAALAIALTCGDRAVLIGSDTPDLPPSLVADAFRALDTADVVLGPAADGGFYLVGVRQQPGALFEGVVWSTDTVAARVQANARCLGRTLAFLEPWADVDDEASLTALARRIETNGAAAATRTALDNLGVLQRARS